MRSVLITGGNTGLGFACAQAIARAGPLWQVVLACRDAGKAGAAVTELRAATGNTHVHALALDLASLRSVKACVATVRAGGFAPLKAVVCNAGMSRTNGPARTEDGLEPTFQVNYLGHFLLVLSLLPELREAGRVVLVSSELHRNTGKMERFLPRYTTAAGLAHPPEEEERVRDIQARRYSTTKLCLLLFQHELVLRLQRNGLAAITVNAFNPGLMPDTGLGDLNKHLFQRLFLKYILPLFARGAVSTPAVSGPLLAALATDARYATVTNAYFDRQERIAPSEQSRDPALQQDLWNTSLALSGLPADLLP